jgi:hypothetical protein
LRDSGKSLKSGTLLLLSVILAILGACGGEQGPVQVVQSFMTAVEAFDLGTAESLVCEAQRGKVRTSLEPFEDIATLGEAFDISLGELSFQERSNDGNVAVVHVSGKLTVNFLGQQEVQEVNEEHVVIKENGHWLVCDP